MNPSRLAILKLFYEIIDSLYLDMVSVAIACCNILDINNEIIFVLRSIMFLDHTTGDLKETTREEKKNQFTINYRRNGELTKNK